MADGAGSPGRTADTASSDNSPGRPARGSGRTAGRKRERESARAAIRAALQDGVLGVDGFDAGAAAEPYDIGDQADSVEIHPELPRIDPKVSFGATMALWHPPRFTAWELLDTVNEVLEGTGTRAEFDEEMKEEARQQPRFSLLGRRAKGPPSAILRVNGLKVLVGGADRPAFRGDALKARVNPALWAEGVRRLSASRGHVAIADAHPPSRRDVDLSYDRAVAVTVTAAAVSLLTDPCGIIWHPAGNATPPDVIPDFIQSLVDGVAPLPLWLRWLLIPPAEGRGPGVASRGLEPLLGREIEILPKNQSLEKTVGHLFEIAHRQVLKGTPLADGGEVGTRSRTWYFVVYEDRGVVTNAPVFRLTPVYDYTGGLVGWEPI